MSFKSKPAIPVEDGVKALQAGVQPTTRAFVNHFHTSGPRALALLWKLEYHKLVGSPVRGKREVFV